MVVIFQQHCFRIWVHHPSLLFIFFFLLSQLQHIFSNVHQTFYSLYLCCYSFFSFPSSLFKILFQFFLYLWNKIINKQFIICIELMNTFSTRTCHKSRLISLAYTTRSGLDHIGWGQKRSIGRKSPHWKNPQAQNVHESFVSQAQPTSFFLNTKKY